MPNDAINGFGPHTLKLKPRNLLRPFHPPPPFLTGLVVAVVARGSDAASSRVAFCQRRKLRHPLKLILSSALSAAHDTRVNNFRTARPRPGNVQKSSKRIGPGTERDDAYRRTCRWRCRGGSRRGRRRAAACGPRGRSSGARRGRAPRRCRPRRRGTAAARRCRARSRSPARARGRRTRTPRGPCRGTPPSSASSGASTAPRRPSVVVVTERIDHPTANQPTKSKSPAPSSGRRNRVGKLATERKSSAELGGRGTREREKESRSCVIRRSLRGRGRCSGGASPACRSRSRGRRPSPAAARRRA
jgi:hypothetical protein